MGSSTTLVWKTTSTTMTTQLKQALLGIRSQMPTKKGLGSILGGPTTLEAKVFCSTLLIREHLDASQPPSAMTMMATPIPEEKMHLQVKPMARMF